MLLRDSDPATEPQGCDIRSGSWLDPYDRSSRFSDPGDVSIDHVVPLAHAHRAGAWQWDTSTKRAFGNDLVLDATLAATGTGTNGSKGMKGPDEWLPPAEAAHCTYAVDWVAIKWRWSLDVRPAEQAELSRILSGWVDDRAAGAVATAKGAAAFGEVHGGEALSLCTSGFGSRSNSYTSGTRGILTAAHCPNSLTDDGDTLTYQSGHKESVEMCSGTLVPSPRHSTSTKAALLPRR